MMLGRCTGRQGPLRSAVGTTRKRLYRMGYVAAAQSFRLRCAFSSDLAAAVPTSSSSLVWWHGTIHVFLSLLTRSPQSDRQALSGRPRLAPGGVVLPCVRQQMLLFALRMFPVAESISCPRF